MKPIDLYPAIDIRNGNCVRLYQGDYDRETVYGDNPADQAAAFVGEGAAWIHVVDLDAARSGEQQNLASIAAIANRVHVPMQVGGGVRTVEAAKRLWDAGVTRVVIGTAAVQNPELVRELAPQGQWRLASTHGAPILPLPDGKNAPVRICSRRLLRSVTQA